MSIRKILAGSVGVAAIVGVTFAADGEKQRIIDDFSVGRTIVGGIPPGWHATQREVNMFSVKDDGQGRGNLALSIDTRGGSTTIAKRFIYRVQEFPVLRWRWRVHTLPEGGREDQRRTGDSGAGVYVIFKGKMRLNRMIKYVWSATLPTGTLTESPYNSRVKIIVLQSGESSLNTWKAETVDVRADYERAFNESDPPEVEAIGIMSDADDTNSAARADYDDLLVCKERES